jgi:serine/threonine protein kinase
VIVDKEILGHLFISYSHLDRSYMRMFRKHLQGMLRDRMQVWSDQEISKGAGWESLLKGNLTQAASALVLASPDYLVSPWCRRELKELANAHRGGRLRNLFWVQLKPCGWQHTELAEFQSFELNVEQAISEAASDIQRDRAILQACKDIASGIDQSVTNEDKLLALIRLLLVRAPVSGALTVNKVLHEGAFSIVCSGSMGSIDACVKMLRNLPLQTMMEDFIRIGKQRMTVADPAFLRIHDLFPVNAPDQSRSFMVSDYLSHNGRLSEFLGKGKPMPVDHAAALLRRTAEALSALHKAGVAQHDSDTEWEWTLGFVTPSDIYYDQDSARLRIAPLGVSSFLWHVLDWDRFVKWVDQRASAYQLPEQLNRPSERATRKADQYVLARLGLELLEGKSFDCILGAKSLEEFWEKPESFITGIWKDNHRQLWGILNTMLRKDPRARWGSMDEVVRKLRALEESGRALAKRTYVLPQGVTADHAAFHLENNTAFFKTFYDSFFSASKESAEKFTGPPEQQHRKLMDAMVSVLNFREGNSPTSLDQFLAVHRGKGITTREFEQFRVCFIKTLKTFADDEEVKAWDDLFKPAVEYMVPREEFPSS